MYISLTEDMVLVGDQFPDFDFTVYLLAFGKFPNQYHMYDQRRNRDRNIGGTHLEPSSWDLF